MVYHPHCPPKRYASTSLNRLERKIYPNSRMAFCACVLLVVLPVIITGLSIGGAPTKQDDHSQEGDQHNMCPLVCSCTFNSGLAITMDCSLRGLTAVPNALPTSLTRLVLAHNAIRHLRCNDFKHLSSLTYLDLSDNHLQTLQDESRTNSNETNACFARTESFEGMTLTRVEENGNMASGKEMNQRKQKANRSPLSFLVNLQTLILEHNRIDDLESHAFYGLFHLTSLNLAKNSFHKLNMQAFKGLSGLKSLNLGDNPLAPLPDAVFEDLVELTTLIINLEYNADRCYSDKALARLTSLTSLYINGLPSPQCILGHGFQKLTKLSSIDFSYSGCQIEIVPNNFFSNISTKANLSIRLTDCLKLTHIHRDAFSFLPTMIDLDFGGSENFHCNNFFIASASLPKTNIKRLNLRGINYGDFLKITSGLFEYLEQTSLESLCISHNNILTFDRGVACALPKTLKKIDLSSNSILRPDFIFTMAFLPNLEILDISAQNDFHLSTTYDETMDLRKSDVCQVLKPIIKTDRKENFMDEGNLRKLEANNQRPHCKDGDKDELEEKLTSFIYEQNLLQTGSITFEQWNLLVNSVCPDRVTLDIHQSKLNLTGNAMEFTKNTIRKMLWILSDSTFTRKIKWNQTKWDRLHHPIIPFPRNLKKMYASRLKLGYAIPEFEVQSLNNLWFLNMSDNFLWCFGGPVRGFNALNVFDLSNNYAFVVNTRFFSAMKNITHLYLSNNKLAVSFKLDVEGKILSYLDKLELLDLSRNSLKALHKDAFGRNVQLRQVKLSHNDLPNLPRLFHLTHLEWLNASNNLIEFLSDEAMADLEHIRRSSNLSVDLSNNPFKCDCSSLSFQLWFLKSKSIFYRADNYTCKYINGKIIPLVDAELYFETLWRLCHGEAAFLGSIVLCLTTFLIISSVALTAYYRYRLLFYVYLSKKRFFYSCFELEPLRMRDVFLVYDDQDIECRQHVIQVVIPNFVRHGLSYHVSEIGMDRPSAGRSIREVIEEAVLGGRKTVVLLTRDIFMDEEKQLEVSMAQIVQEMMGSRRLLFLAAQKVDRKTLPTHIYRLLRTSRIISYLPKCEQFWGKLAREIKGH